MYDYVDQYGVYCTVTYNCIHRIMKCTIYSGMDLGSQAPGYTYVIVINLYLSSGEIMVFSPIIITKSQ